MGEAPERIWLTGFVKDQYGARLGRGTISDLDHGNNPDYPEYVRADRIEELEAKLAKAVARIDKLIYWLDIDDGLWDALTAMEKSDHRRAQSEAQAIKSILTGGKDE